MTDRHQILRSTRLVTFITLLSRLFGYVRDLVMALLLGTSLAADAFVLAFRIPNLLRRLVAEGAMTGAFVPVFTQYRAQRPAPEAWDFANRMFWTLAAVLAGVTLLGVVFAPALVRLFTIASPAPEQWREAVLLTRVMFPYCLLVALSALAGAALNTEKVFGLPASTPIVLNLAILVAAGVAYFSGYQHLALALSIGVVVGGLFQLLVQVPALLRHGMSFRPAISFRHPGIRRVARLMLPAVAGVGIYQINVLISTAFATTDRGWVSSLYYANRVTEVALGVYAISVATVILPAMSAQAAGRDLEGLKQTLGFALRNVAFLIVPATVGLMVLSTPITRVLFQYRAFSQQSTQLTSDALTYYALGLPAFAAVRLVVQAFYAVQDTITPVWGAAVALGANLGLCFLLVGPMEQGGLALATSLASYLNFFVLYGVLRARQGALAERPILISLGRTLVASLGMAAFCMVLARWLGLLSPQPHGRLLASFLATLAAGGLSYLALAWLLRAEELHEVYTLVTGRRVELAPRPRS